ncbi:hypothetical protein BHM03_00031192 [Ensete ventricosum]|nr:hypothetical protein BHM03_00031192 [Ensete ventricosum]
MIRASIGQGQMTMPGKLNMRPAPTTENKSKVQASDFRQAKVDKHDDIEEHNDDAEDEDEDDDWDAFQSFPANTASVSAIDSRDGKTISEPAPCDEPSTVNNHQLNRNNGHDHDLFQPNVCEEDNDAQDVSPGQAKEMTSLKMEEFEEDSSIRYSNELVAEDSSDRSQDLYHESSEVNEDGTSTVHNSLPSTVLGRDEEPTKKEGKAVQLEVEATDKARDVCIEMHHDAMPADSEDTERNNSSQHQFHEGEVQSVCLDHGDDSNESFNDVLIAQDDNQKEADGPNSSLESRGDSTSESLAPLSSRAGDEGLECHFAKTTSSPTSGCAGDAASDNALPPGTHVVHSVPVELDRDMDPARRRRRPASPSPAAPPGTPTWLAGNNAHMLHIFNRGGVCLLRTLDANQDQKLMFGLLFSLRSFTAKMDPTRYALISAPFISVLKRSSDPLLLAAWIKGNLGVAAVTGPRAELKEIK